MRAKAPKAAKNPAKATGDAKPNRTSALDAAPMHDELAGGTFAALR